MMLLFTGDVNFRGKGQLTFAESRNILAGVQPYLDRADFRIPNLECPLAHQDVPTPIWKSGPNLICEPENICFLKEMGADAVTLANNHIGDYGEAAVNSTLALLEQNSILHAGAGQSLGEAYRPIRLSKGDTSVSIISVCENEFGVASDDTAGSAGYNPRMLFKCIQEERTRTNRVIVVFHGGNEFNPFPSPDTVDRYRFLCDMGADAVIGGHTHCPQGYEIYNGKPIVYSLGNFLFKSNPLKPAEDSWHYGYLPIIDIRDELNLEIVPYRFDPEATHIEVFEGEARRKMLEYISFLSSVIQRPEELECYFIGWAWNHKWCPSLPKSEPATDYSAPPNFDLVSCEAHYSQLKTLLRTYYKREEKTAQEWALKAVAAQIMPV